MKRLDWTRLRPRPLAERENKVRIEDFAPWPAPGAGPLDLLPDILAGSDWKDFIARCARAARARRPLLFMIGGHVIKTGLSPILITLMERGLVSHLAMNGAAAIHDYEIALQGATSEDVARYLDEGIFGLWEETGHGMNAVALHAAAMGPLVTTGAPGPDGPGFGEALGLAIRQNEFPHERYSVLAAASRLGIPATVHAAIGAEIIHEHPLCSGAAIGEVSHRDFRRLTETVARLRGGVALNWGSAVILPEVFLKSLAMARNLGAPARGFTSATFDMLRQYRPLVNVVERPTRGAGRGAAARDSNRGFFFTGHHEILMPLFYSALTSALEAPAARKPRTRKKGPGAQA